MKPRAPLSSTLLLIALFCIAAPLNAQPVWRSVGPGGGSFLMACAVDPTDANTVYIGGDIEGVFKTTDGGAHWTSINGNLVHSEVSPGIYGIQELVLDPSNPTTLYSATWTGLFRSTTSGGNWQLIYPDTLGEETPPVSYVAVDPEDSFYLIAGIGDANLEDAGAGTVIISWDGGESWEEVALPGSGSAIVHSIQIISTSNAESRTVLVATDEGLYRSTDGGYIYTASNTGLPHTNVRRLREVVNAGGTTSTIYLSIYSEGDPATPPSIGYGLYKSIDEGQSWTSINGNLPKIDPDDGESLYHYWKYAVNPDNQNVIYAGTRNDYAYTDLGVYKTVDGGVNWNRVDGTLPQGWLNDSWWNDRSVSLLELAPSDPSILYRGYVEMYSSSDAGATWQNRFTSESGGAYTGNGLELMVSFDFDWGDAVDLVYIGYDDMGLWKSEDGGTSFSPLDPSQDYAYDCAHSLVVDPANGDLYLGRSQGTNDEEYDYANGILQKSTNGGDSFTQIGAGQVNEGQPVLLLDPTSPTNARTLYAAMYGQGIYRSEDSGANWSYVSTGLADDAAFVWDIAMDPNDANTLYAAINTRAALSGGVYKSTNGGMNWSKLSASTDHDVLDVEVGPNGNVLIGTTVDYGWAVPGGGVFRSTDGGDSWDRILDQAVVWQVVAHPTDPDIVFAGVQHPWNGMKGTTAGIYRTLDGGASWANLTDGLNHGQIMALRLNTHDPTQLWAGTNGGGVFVLDNALTDVPEVRQVLPKTFALQPVYPNPFNPNATVRYELAQPGEVRLELFNLLGRRVAVLAEGPRAAGSHTITLDGSGLASGTYLLRLLTVEHEETRRVVLLK